MGHFNYTNARFRDTNCIAVKCDICKAVLWTEITGQEFGQHIGVAREHGWEHRKNKDGKWIDMCDECVRLYREKKRQEYFPTMQFITLPQEQNEPAKQDTEPQGRDQTEPQQITAQRVVYVEKKSQRVQLLMQPSIAQRAKAEADRLNISFNEYIHRAVLEKLEREDTSE